MPFHQETYLYNRATLVSCEWPSSPLYPQTPAPLLCSRYYMSFNYLTALSVFYIFMGIFVISFTYPVVLVTKPQQVSDPSFFASHKCLSNKTSFYIAEEKLY